MRSASLSWCPTWSASDAVLQGAVSSTRAASWTGFSVSAVHMGRLWSCSVFAVFSWTSFECASSPLLFLQACAIRDPNSGYVFDLNPLNSSQGYVVSGIGKTFVVRLVWWFPTCLERTGGRVQVTCSWLQGRQVSSGLPRAL